MLRFNENIKIFSFEVWRPIPALCLESKFPVKFPRFNAWILKTCAPSDMILYKYLVNWAQSVQTDIEPPVRMLFDHTLTQALLISISSILLPALAQDDLSSLADAIPGVPGEDFPIFGELPSTSFLCEGRQQGYYADPEVRLPTTCELWAVRNLSRLTARCSISVWTRTSSLLLSRTTLSFVQMGLFSGGVIKVEIFFFLRIRFWKL